MKIIDFIKKGNAVRFILGDDNCTDYWGDDWNDAPYEHNAGSVYGEYIKGYRDVFFPVDWTVLEPSEDWCNGGNSNYCKEDFKMGYAPCIIAAAPSSDCWTDDRFGVVVARKDIIRFYFEDEMEPGEPIIWNESYKYYNE